MVTYFGSIPRGRESLTKLAMLVQSFQIRPNSHSIHLLQTLLFIISATVTTGYVKIPSNFYHQLSIPQCPGRHMVSSLCVFHPQEIKPLSSLSFTKSSCQKENHSSAVTSGKKESEDFTRRTERAKEEENMAVRQREATKCSRTFCPREAHSPGCLEGDSPGEGYQKVGFKRLIFLLSG